MARILSMLYVTPSRATAQTKKLRMHNTKNMNLAVKKKKEKNRTDTAIVNTLVFSGTRVGGIEYVA